MSDPSLRRIFDSAPVIDFVPALDQALPQREVRLRLLGDGLPECAVYSLIREADGSEHYLYVSDGIRQLRGVSSEEVLQDAGILRRQILPDYLPKLDAAERRSARAMSPLKMDLPIRRTDGKLQWIRLQSRPQRLRDGRVIWDGVQIDITERKHQENQIRHMLREVNHRSKNLLTLVQAVACQTLAARPEEFVDRFGKRLEALAASHDLLVENAWQGADLKELVTSQLAHFEDLIGSRIKLQGPHLFVPAPAARVIGMVLHELATNAGKYGALTSSAGSVKIEWHLEHAEAGKKTFVISWREQDGPAVTTPSQVGFGSTLIGSLAETSLNAKVDLDFAVTGLIWQLRCEAGEILEADEPEPTDTSAGIVAVGPGPRSSVLVVEDEPLVAIEIARVLDDAGFHVIGPTGAVGRALSLIDERGCDAAVLDINLGRETSEPVAHRLRAIGTPFVTLSGYSTTQYPTVFSGASALAKPLRPELLVAELKRCLKKGADVA